MMRFLSVLLFSLCFVIFSNPVMAQEKKYGALISGAYLFELCKRDESGGEQAEGAHIACQSYIAGLIDYHSLLRSLGVAPDIDLCVPPETPLKDLQDIVFTFLKKNEQHDAFIAAPAVSLALFEHFPCPRSKKK